MAELIGIFHDSEAARAPAANAWKVLYTVVQHGSYSVHVANGEGSDAHVDIAVLAPADAGAFTDGGTPPAYSIIHKKQRIQADGTDGNYWDTPVINLQAGCKIGVRTDLVGVTFCNNGIQQ